MKVIVNSGRTVTVALKPGSGSGQVQRVLPEVKKHGPGSIIDLPDEEAKDLIRRGAVRKFEEPKAAEISAPDAA